jgi:hypothetical protein
MSGTPVWPTGYPLTINSHHRNPYCKFQDMQNNYLMRSQKILEGFDAGIKSENSN